MSHDFIYVFWEFISKSTFYILGSLLLLLVICAVIFIHEFGHYFFARLVKVKVKEFSVGFGPSLSSFYDDGGTKWVLAIIPLGGFVSLEERFLESSRKIDYLKRIFIAFGGPLFNMLTALILLIFITIAYLPSSVKINSGNTVVFNKDNFLNLHVNDVILEGEVIQVENKKQIDNQKNKPLKENLVNLSIKRNGETFVIENINLNELKSEVALNRLGLLLPLLEKKRDSSLFFKTILNVFVHFSSIFFAILYSIKSLIVGLFFDHNIEVLNNYMGPVGIFSYSFSKIAEVGSFVEFFSTIIPFLIAIMFNFSLAVSLFNLLPILPLDGGHILMDFISIFLNKHLVDYIRIIVYIFGLLFVLFLFLAITLKDIFYFFTS